MKKILGIFSCAVLLFASCRKDDRSDDVTKENLTGSYKLTAAVSKTGNQPEENELEQMEACEKDDITKLNADWTCNFIDAGTRCVPPGDENSTWSLPSSSQIIINNESFTIKSFNGRTLVIYSAMGSGDNTYTYTTTLVKQ